jgi:hypothetical protein
MNKLEIEKAIDGLKVHKEYGLEIPDTYCETAISVLEEQINYGWVIVSEGLPKDSERRHVYVTARHIEGTGSFTANMIWEYGKFIWPNGKEVADKWKVLAWMPEKYPEPYKEVPE